MLQPLEAGKKQSCNSNSQALANRPKTIVQQVTLSGHLGNAAGTVKELGSNKKSLM
jgi:hypothetical protein